MSDFIPLEDIRIARPCRADWNTMTGDERVRFCGSCEKNVYDISRMTREAAHQLIAEKEGQVCLRLYRRPDGTVITADCPVGKREVARPMWWTLAGFIALLGSGVAVWSQPAAPPNCPPPASQTPLAERARTWPVVGAAVNLVSPPPVVMMGDIAVAPTMGVPAPPPSATPAPVVVPAHQTHPTVTMGAPLPPAPSATPSATPIEPEMGEVYTSPIPKSQGK